MNDGGEELAVYLLDAACQVVDAHTRRSTPTTPRTWRSAADGTIWLADTGDNNATRTTVALLALRPDGTTGVFRLTYPDGPHDAEALLLAPDGTPYVVTKEVLGASGVYSPSAPLVDGGTVALAKVAAVNMTLTGTRAARSAGPVSSWSPAVRCPPTAATWRCAPTPTPTSGPWPAATWSVPSPRTRERSRCRTRRRARRSASRRTGRACWSAARGRRAT